MRGSGCVTARLQNGERAFCRRGAPWARGFRRSVSPERGSGHATPRIDGCRTRVGLLHERSRCWRFPSIRGSVLLERTAGFSPPWGPQREKPLRVAPGLGTAPGGSCGRSALLNRRRGGAAGAEGAAVPPRGGGNAAGCAEAAAAISRRTVPPMESTWNSPGWRGRAGKCSVAVRHRRDEAGLRPPLPWRSRAASEGFGRCGPQSRLPRGGCAARSRAAERPGTGAELHLIGAVVSLTGQSLRNRAKTTEGAERSSSAQVLGRVPEPGILSLALCPSTPRSLRGSASPLRCLQKGQQPFSVPSQAPAGPELCPWGHAASCHLVASGAAGEALPRH